MPAGLVDHDQIAVLIKDSQRQRFGLSLRFDRFRDLDGHVLAGFDRLVRLGRASLQQDPAVFDQPLNPRPGLIRRHRDEEHIQPGVLTVLGTVKVRCSAARFRALFGAGSFRRAR